MPNILNFALLGIRRVTTKNLRKIPCKNLNIIHKELTGLDGHSVGMVDLANIVARHKGWPELQMDTPHKQEYAKHYLYLYQLERDRAFVYLDNDDQEYFVYFIQAGDSGPIKIGFTNNVERRLSGLQTGCANPLNIIAKLPFKSKAAASRYERELHDQFSPYRLTGEWFSKRILARLSEARCEVVIDVEEKSIFDYVREKRNFPRKFKLEKKHTPVNIY